MHDPTGQSSVSDLTAAITSRNQSMMNSIYDLLSTSFDEHACNQEYTIDVMCTQYTGQERVVTVILTGHLESYC
jgi:hypothetical protein